MKIQAGCHRQKEQHVCRVGKSSLGLRKRKEARAGREGGNGKPWGWASFKGMGEAVLGSHRKEPGVPGPSDCRKGFAEGII